MPCPPLNAKESFPLKTAPPDGDNVDRGLAAYPECTVDEDLDPMALLQKEIARKILEDERLRELNRKRDVSVYHMKKNQMFYRMQQEKNEKEYQECLCRKDRERQQRKDQICQEELFAKAMREMKDEEIREDAFRKQLYACAPEIRELEAELRRGYFAKTLHAQQCEKEMLELEAKKKEDEWYQEELELLMKADALANEKKKQDWTKKKEYFQSLSNQLQDNSSKKVVKQEEYDRDKAMVDEIIAAIQEEEIQDLMEKTEKVNLYKKEINSFLQAREMHRERERSRIKEEEEKVRQFMAKKEEQVRQLQQAKEAQEKAKAAIVAKAIERIIKAQSKIEEMDNLRRQLHEEETYEAQRNKDIEDLAKKVRQMKDLQAAADEAKRQRDQKIADEKKEEQDFREQLMKKFAEDERLEQMANQKRRMRECEHRKAVEKMILDRRCLKAQERAREQCMLDCFDLETKRREKIIAEERLKLLRKHGPQLLGFLPRGILKSWEEIECLGEPFVSYYKCQPREPHPSTIDTVECEEELFATMEKPKNARF